MLASTRGVGGRGFCVESGAAVVLPPTLFFRATRFDPFPWSVVTERKYVSSIHYADPPHHVPLAQRPGRGCWEETGSFNGRQHWHRI